MESLIMCNSIRRIKYLSMEEKHGFDKRSYASPSFWTMCLDSPKIFIKNIDLLFPWLTVGRFYASFLTPESACVNQQEKFYSYGISCCCTQHACTSPESSNSKCTADSCSQFSNKKKDRSRPLDPSPEVYTLRLHS